MAINRLVYVSKLKISAEDPKYNRVLVNVLMGARTYNKSKNITGVLFLSGRTCVQILEGDSNELGKLMFKISRDDRHDDVKILYNKKVNERLYSGCSMKLLSVGTLLYRESIIKFKQSDEDAYSRMVGHMGGIFNFAESDETKKTEVKDDHPVSLKNYTDSYLSISNFPKASQLQLSSRSVRLCSLLVAKEVTFDDLSHRLIYKSDAELKHNLEQLDSLGILSVKPLLISSLSAGDVERHQQPKKRRFSQLLKGFIASNGGK